MLRARAGSIVLAAGLSSLTPVAAEEPPGANRFGFYYSGPPCPEAVVDRTFSEFQVNLDPDAELVVGRLGAAPDGRALLENGAARGVELLSNASRADWLLGYPLLDSGAGVWGRPIFGPGCAVQDGAFYVEALFPLALLMGGIDPELDLMNRDGYGDLKDAVRRYRWSLSKSDEALRAQESPAGPGVGAGSKLQKALFEEEAATCPMPWRARLMGAAEPLSDTSTVDVLLSGADGSTGVFGHISVGHANVVYNIYPRGSDRGAPDFVPLWDYLFNTVRGHAIRRPTWLLRIQGVPAEVVAAFDNDMRTQIEDIQEGRSVYHPTANNCTTASLQALRHLGIEVGRPRYFTRRFPRLAFGLILDRLPGLLASGRLQAKRVELMYIPQVPVRPAEGRAPNRPLKDRSRIG